MKPIAEPDLSARSWNWWAAEEAIERTCLKDPEFPGTNKTGIPRGWISVTESQRSRKTSHCRLPVRQVANHPLYTAKGHISALILLDLDRKAL